MLTSKTLPLSHGQQALWFLYRKAPTSAAYNMALPLQFTDPLDPAILQAAVAWLVAHHSALRTQFGEQEGIPYQRVTTESLDDWQAINATGWNDQALMTQVQQVSQRPFELETTGFRATLFHGANTGDLLLLTLHHIAGDATSLAILGQQVVQVYAALATGKPITLATATADYGDYLRWETELLNSRKGQRMTAYWQTQLAGEVPTLQLPPDLPRPPLQTFNGASQTFELTPELTQRLTTLAKAQKTTLFTVLLSAYQVLLHRYSGQTEIWVGVPTSTPRTRPQFTDLVGYLVNLMIVRARFPQSEDLRFSELLPQTSSQILAGLYHQPYPFAWLVEQLQPQRDPSYPPLVQAMFALEQQDLIPRRFTAHHVTAHRRDIAQMEGQFDLSLVFSKDSAGHSLSGILSYNRDLFTQATIARLIGHLRLLLETVVTETNQSVHRIPLRTPAEQQQLQAWNQTATAYPLDNTIIDLFEQQVATTPDQIAVVFKDQTLSYHALNCKANQLAHYLITLGVRADTLVGICVERSLEMVVGLLGILKAGGAYVPLDPDYPAERLQFMLEDSQVSVLLTQPSLPISRFVNSRFVNSRFVNSRFVNSSRVDKSPPSPPSPPSLSFSMVNLDSDWEPMATYSGENPLRQANPAHLAYLIYTSGSTGQPKGVMIEHRGLSNLIHAQTQAFGLHQGSRLLQFASFSFDASVSEIATTLTCGATLILGATRKFLPDESFIQLLRDQAITHITLPPAFLKALPLQALPSLETLVVAGEASSAELVEQWAIGRTFINAYGPTEGTVCATLSVCEANGQTPAIGKPMANTRVYILDAHQNLTPLGVPGELCIAGVGLARGYHNRPELTAEKFIEVELFGTTERVYKTGDLARWLPDGDLEYLGRLDHQIKLRGFRIELGEIEATLTQHEAVTEAVVVLREAEKNPKLAAYVTVTTALDEVEKLSFPKKLNVWLKTRLPDYMVPASVTVLEKLPFTPTGKIDRQALPAPDLTALANTYEAPRTDIEQRLTEVWRQVLKQPHIGIFDNFFERGGDSILSIQIVARARAAGMELKPQDLFQHQTIAALAQVARPLTSKLADQGEVIGELPFTPIQQRFFDQLLPEPWHFNQAILLAIPADINKIALPQAFTAILQHHDALRLRFRQVDGQWQGWHEESHLESNSSELGWHLEDLRQLSPTAQLAALRERAEFWQTSLNLTTGPLQRLVFFHLGKEARLLWCIHHLVVDGVSFRILLEDLHTAYQQAVTQQPIRLPPKTTAFQVWAERLRQWPNHDSFLAQTAYWRQLSAATPLPIDFPTGANRLANSQHYTIQFSVALTQRLLTETPAAYRTRINDLLLTALMLTLRDWTGQLHHLIDVESHGRADLFAEVDLTRTVGWFTALHTLSLQLPAGDALGTALKAIKEQLRQIPYEGIGYGVQRYLHHDSLPQGQILFNYLGQFDQSMQNSDWQFATEDSGPTFSPRSQRDHLIEINGHILQGSLSLTWTYSGEQYRAATLQTLADGYQQHLQHLIEHCATANGYTRSDFPLVALTLVQLETLAQSYGNQIADLYPLSPMQQGLLFHTLYAPDSGIYFEQMHLSVTGPLNQEAFQQAWQILVERHAILRTAFWHQLEAPIQVVCKTVPLHWQTLDWRALSNTERQHRLSELLDSERRQGFELTQAPLMRIQLIRETDDQARLVWHFHHILMDGWCFPILLTEWLTTYRALVTGQPPRLPPVRPYQAYIQWLTQQDREAAKNYWQGQLQGFPAPTPLPLVTVSSRATSASYQIVTLNLATSLTQQLQHFSRQQRITLNTLVQGAWAALLSRYSGEEDIVFGVTVSGGQVPLLGIEQMVGLFINTLPLRVKLTKSDIVLNSLNAIQQQQQQHNQYAHLSLAEIQKWSAVEGNAALFDTLVTFENYPIDAQLQAAQQAAGIYVTDWQAIEYTNYPITLTVLPGDTLHFKLSYDSHRFRQDSLERMLAHLSNLLAAICTQPTQSWYQLPLLTPTEQQQWLAWNQGETDYSSPLTLVELFQTQVEATPDHIAVVFEGETLTYRQLNNQANQIAHYLMSLGVHAETLVGFCVERSMAMVIGLLGILKAGGAYVPLDPTYPAERLQFMLEDSQVSVLLTQASLPISRFVNPRFVNSARVDKSPPSRFVNSARVDKSPPSLGFSVVNLDSDWNQIALYPKANPPTQSTPDNLAYVIYTSGSTGKPKGCLVTHANVTRLFAATQDWYHFTSQEVWTLFHSYAFDFSVWEIWGALLYGGKLVIVPYLTSRTPEAFYQLLIDHQVTVLNQTPSAFKQLIRVDNQPQQLALRLVIFGGEALDFASLQPWFDQHGDTHPQLVNMYGITETTVHVTYYPLTAALAPTRSVIGRPIPDLPVWLLDPHHQLVPLGVPGEMYVGGAGVSRGYLNRPELTRERFVELDLLGHSQRLYKTGDLARLLPDGNLEYLGRLDQQVKLRGFRIELGEIETLLCTHAAVREAVVILHGQADQARLFAYVTLYQPLPDVAGELRLWLKASLPDYMIPAGFMVLPQLPLTANGKVNRNALPTPELTVPTELQTPRTETEQMLGSLWSQVLGTDITSPMSDFFAAGGHSLLATQLVSRIRESFKIEMPLRIIFERPLLKEQAQWLEEAQRGPALPPILPLAEGTPLVPSFAQQRLWFLAQLEGQSATYNLPVALHLTGRLDEAALQSALTTLVARHDSLRLRFPVVAGKLTVQRGEVYNPLVITAVSDSLPTTQQEFISTWLDQQVRQTFDLATGPLWRCHLLKLSQQEHVLLFNMHHIISDGWSMEILIREWSQLYETPHQPALLPALTIQYTDYATWQRHWLQAGVLEQQLAYWRGQLAGVPELLALPTDYPRPAVLRYQGKHLKTTLTLATSQAVKQLARQQGATVFMTLLAAFNVLLYRYSGQSDVVIGSPIANRTHQQTEELIGFFVNTLVLRTQVQPQQTFLELLQQVRQTALAAYSHQDIPFEYLVEQVNPARSLSYSPLFQVMFALQNTATPTLPLRGLNASFLLPENLAAKFDLTLNIGEEHGLLACYWEYNTDLFQAHTVARLGEHFQILLTEILQTPDQPMVHLQMLTPAELQQLQNWNQTATHYPLELTIVDLFEQQAALRPHHLALIFGEQTLSYQALNRQANQLAHYLMTLGVCADTLVGICVERSLEMVIGLLGILKAGGAYVPLDPDYPTERLQFMLEDSQVSVLLTQPSLPISRFVNSRFVNSRFVNSRFVNSRFVNSSRVDKSPPSLTSLSFSMVNLDSDWNQIATYSEENPLRQANPVQLAYLIYTSGSTGQPKGVMIEHRGLSNLIQVLRVAFEIHPDSRLLQFASLNFDASVLEMAPMLASGATLIINSTGKLLPDDPFIQLIKQHAITHLFATPSFLAALPPQTLPTVATIIVGGEACSAELVTQWAPGRKFINAYGPTEGTVCVTLMEYEANGEVNSLSTLHSPLSTKKAPPIGKPIANTRIYILDAHQQLTPPGVPGELCIAGIGLARGYLNQPALTADKFVTVTLFGKTERLYKTGDLARWLPEGTLEYLGRLDQQVKLRGFRIELGEIEARLIQHEAVQEAVVVLSDQDELPRLVAYVTLAQDCQSSTDRQSSTDWQSSTDSQDWQSFSTMLRTWLSARLPDYMLPASILVLPQLPLMPNGKLDRKALPVPDFASQGESQTPRTDTEQLLCHLWSQLLGVDITSRQSDFFAVGGHSLLATQLVSRIRDSFGIDVPLRLVFEHPVLHAQATWLEGQQRGFSLPPITPKTPGEPLVQSYAQQRLWFLAQLEGPSATYNIPVALRLVGLLEESALQQALDTLIQRHENLCLSFPSVAGEASVQVNAPYNPLTVIDLRHLPTEERQRAVTQWVDKHALMTFDLNTGPLLSLHLLKLSEAEHVLLFNMHHIISDGWSSGILIREWGQLYNAFAQQQDPSLPPLPIQYTDYAAWQRRWLTGEVLAKQLTYWTQQLAGVPELLELPTDYPRPARMRYQGRHLRTTLASDLAQGLQQFSQQHRVTLFMTLLAAFKVLLYRYSGQTDMVVGSPIANRTHQQTEELIGFFVNTLVLRTQLSAHLTFTDLLKQVRQTALEAYSHQDVPFEQLVERLNPPRSLSHSPLFQVVFVLQNAPTTALTLHGLEMSGLEPEYCTAKFDLTLGIGEPAGQWVCDWEYNTDLFAPSTIVRLSQHFVVLLQGILQHPNTAIAQLPLLTVAEQQQLLAWNQGETDYATDLTLSEWFETQVAATPNNLALVFENQTLTYHELNSQANQLAHYLTTLGVRADTLVGLCVERSVEMVVGILGILKAGGAYLPLDPAYPAERLQFMLEDSQVSVFLTQASLPISRFVNSARVDKSPPSRFVNSRFVNSARVDKSPPSSRVDKSPPSLGFSVVNLDSDWNQIALYPKTNPPTQSTPDNLAYVIYTSGSTGKPKGCLVTHANVTRLFTATNDWYHFGQQEVWTLFHSYAFDFSVWEIWGALLYGGKLVVVPYLTSRTPAAFYQLLLDHQVTVLNQTPSAFKQLIMVDNQPQQLALRLVIFGGEALDFTSLQPWFDRHGDTHPQLVNMYGITETTVHVTYYPLTRGQDNSRSLIGRPIPDLSVWLLDPQQQLVPLGLPGELYVGGAGVSRGYLNRPELTHERFVELDLLGHSQRLYKTGDLARLLPDGTLEYLGRIDQQVKLRGFRIELGEIETLLCTHEAIREAVVVLHGKDEEARLVAYVTLQGSLPISRFVNSRFVNSSRVDKSPPSRFVNSRFVNSSRVDKSPPSRFVNSRFVNSSRVDKSPPESPPEVDKSPPDVANELRSWLKTRLPEYMIPAGFIVLPQLPLTANGKTDRNALPNPEVLLMQSHAAFLPPQTVLERELAAIWQEVLKLDAVGIADNFFDLGGHSLLLLKVHSRLQAWLGPAVPVVTLFQYPTIQSLAAHLATTHPGVQLPKVENIAPTSTDPDSRGVFDIAIIGLAGRFPKAANIDEFWHNLRNGYESLQFFSDEELLAKGVDPVLLANPNYVKAGMVLEEIELFDSQFFGYSPKEAEVLDPQQRFFLETAWTAMEQAGYDVTRLEVPVGVFAGAGASTYLINNLLPNRAQLEAVHDLQLVLGDGHFSAASVAYKLGLTGPAMLLYTACSTSLVAVHTACRSLLNNECVMALAGGVAIPVPQQRGYLYQTGMITSPDGHCRAFDANAQGTVGGAGVGVVVLKRLHQALADGDTIHAVIKASAINNDGMDKVGFTAPSVNGQAAVITQTMRGLDYESIGYVETHGAGTILGDPIEVAALTQAYRQHTSKTAYCAIGAVKTNIGHLDTAAGVAGLIKTVLALQHQEIPPSLNFEKPNPQIDFAHSPFFVNTQLTPWQSATPRRAGVSSFGIGGTNAHLVLEEAPVQTSAPSDHWQLLCLSARTETALEQYRHHLATYLTTHPEVNLAEVAYTLQQGRKEFRYRGFIVGREVAQVAEQLHQPHPKAWQPRPVGETAPKIAFMFPGQGAQYVNMGKGLYDTEPLFKDLIDECATVLKPLLGADLRELLYPVEGTPPTLKSSGVAQPALFVTEYALAKLCLSWGIKPAAMIGHSIGEYVAACLAGVFSLHDALRLVAIRGQLMQALPAGEMLSILLPKEEVTALLTEDLYLGACNAPNLNVVSGSAVAMSAFVEKLQSQRILHSRLPTANAAHSPLMAPMLAAFREQLQAISRSPLQQPYISNLTGTWITATQAQSVDYWCDHLMNTVLFSEGLQTLLRQDDYLFLEVGPDMNLTSFALQQRPQYQVTAFNLLRTAISTQADEVWILHILGQLWQQNVKLDWTTFYAKAPRLRIPLPTYPFERQRHWIAPPSATLAPATRLVKRPLEEWFYLPTWKPTAPLTLQPGSTLMTISHWLIFKDQAGLGEALQLALEAHGQQVFVVQAGEHFEQHHAHHYTINPEYRDDYQRLFFSLLTATGQLPEAVLHLWGVEVANADRYTSFNPPYSLLPTHFCSLLFVAETWPESESTRHLLTITSETQRVTGLETLTPLKAMALGAVQSINAEYPRLNCRHVDIMPQDLSNLTQMPRLVQQLLEECQNRSTDHQVALRNGQRWIPTVTPIRLPMVPEPQITPLRPQPVYLFLGNLGKMEFSLATYLAQTVQAKLVFIGPSTWPVRSAWNAWLAAHAQEEVTSHLIRRWQELTDYGAEVMVVPVEMGHRDSLAAAVAQIKTQYGHIHGIIQTTAMPTAAVSKPKTATAMVQMLTPPIASHLILTELLADTTLEVMVFGVSLQTFFNQTTMTVNERGIQAFLVASAHQLSSQGVKAIAIHWDEEQTIPEGVQLFKFAWPRMLAHPLPHILLSTMDLEQRLHFQAEANRRALLPPVETTPLESKSSDLGSDYVAPRNPTEQAIAALWQWLLGIEAIDVRDHFFKLGGHSLLGTQVISRLREHFSQDLSIKTLFEYPVLEDLAQYLDTLQQQQKFPTIYPRPVGEPLSLSFAQQRLWILAQLEGQTITYNIPAVVQMDGVLNEAALQRSLIALVERHDSLRACFPMRDGQASLQINPVYNPLEVIDLRDLSGPEQQRAVYEWTDRHAHTAFELSTGPLLTLRLLKLATEKHILLLNIHHIISDGWSMGVLIRDWMYLYNAYAQGQASPLPPLSIQYSDFAVWQRDWLTGEVLEAQRTYWLTQLAGMPELLELPIDYPRPATICYDGKSLQTTLPPWLSRRLKTFSQQHGATLFMTMLAAVTALLYRYSGQQDMAIGSPIANRTHQQTEGLIGFFVNTLVLRTHLHGEMSFLTLLEQVKQTALAAYSHQDISFEYLVEQLNPPRSMSHTPLVQVIFALQNVPKEDLELVGLKASFLDPGHRTVQFDLVLSAIEIGELIACTWRYRIDLFKPETISRLAEHFQVLLTGMLDQPELSLSALPLLTPAEQQQLRLWNQRRDFYPAEKTVVELFEQQVERTPNHIAVVCQEQTLPYQQLNAQANQLAHHLMSLGVTMDTQVAICVAPSLEMVIGLWGILKAGGLYIPLDPNYPPERLQRLLEDSAAPVVLTQSHLQERLPNLVANSDRGGLGLSPGVHYHPQIICLDTDWETIARYPSQNPNKRSGPANLIYLIYTSGFTGIPKGAGVFHKGFTNLVHWYINELGLTANDRTLIISPFGFDLTQKNFYAPLLVGGQLHLLPCGHYDPEVVVQIVADQQITWLNCAPSAFYPLIELCHDNSFLALASLRHTILGGEPIALPRVLPWLQHNVARTRLMNSYGPTECTDVSVTYSLDKPPTEKTIPIGRPIPNVELYILDEYRALLPVGSAGELYIGGDCVGAGYLNDTDLTQAKFIPNPFTPNREARLYKTGDLVRQLPDGNIEYLERVDHQVKLRGFRIELGEIEAVLCQHEAVKEAVVILYQPEDQPRLVAYISLILPLAEVSLTLRAWLKDRLPDYMLPASITVLEKLPLTPNGKIDRNALPAPDWSVLNRTYAAPRTDIERRLATVWSEVLKQSPMGIYDNFFERGGDSILSIQLVARARAAGLAMMPRDLFQQQTIAELARVVRKEAIPWSAEPGAVTGEVPITPIQQWFFAQALPEYWHFNQAVVLAVPADIDAQALSQALAKLIEHHDTLRLRYRQVAGQWRGWHEAVSVAETPFHEEDLRTLSAATLQERGDFWQARLNLEKGPLLRLVLFRLGEEKEARLLWCIHHLVVDGVSWRTLLEDLEMVYRQVIAGQPIQLPAKTTAFKTWAERLFQWKDSEDFAAQMGYWRQLPKAVESLPLDNPTGRNWLADAQHYTTHFAEAVTRRLLTAVPAVYGTQINDVLLAALLLTLRDWAGESKYLLDLESHGRLDMFEEIDTSRTVGWFTALYTVALQLPDGDDLGIILPAVKEQLRSVPYNGIGYGVQRYLNQEDLPQGQILFNYLGQFDSTGVQNEFRLVMEESSHPHSLLEPRQYLIEINGQTINGSLKMTWSYSRQQYRAETVQRLADSYQQQLGWLVEHCVGVGVCSAVVLKCQR